MHSATVRVAWPTTNPRSHRPVSTKPIRRSASGAPGPIGQQEQQVEVGSGPEFPASVTAERQDRDRRDGGDDFAGARDGPRQVQKPDHGAVGEPCAAAQERFDRSVGFEPRTQRGLRAVHQWAYAGKPPLAVQRLARIAGDRAQHVAHRCGKRCRIMTTTQGVRPRSKSLVIQRLCHSKASLDGRRL